MVKGQSIPKQFLERVMQGEEKTVTQWAEVFYDHLDHPVLGKKRVYRMMHNLRKRGHMVFPVKINGDDQPSIVKLVNRDLTHFNAAYQRHCANHTEPSIISGFQIAEKLIEEHPRVKDKVIARAKQLLELAAAANQNMLGIAYEKSGNTLLAGGEAKAGRKQSKTY